MTVALEQYTNNAQTTTTGSVNNSSDPVTFSVTSATGFPTSGQFRVIIDNEILLVTSVSGTSYTASRAQEGTTIATHSSGATVTHILTAASLKTIIGQFALSDTFANRPSAGVPGRLFFPTDPGYIWRDDGTNWRLWAGGMGPFNPNASDFGTWVNQSSASIATVAGLPVLSWTGTQAGGENLNCRVKALPGGGANWTMTLVFKNIPAPGATPNMGIIIYDSSSTKLMGNCITIGGLSVNQYEWNSPTSFSGNPNSDALNFRGTEDFFMLRIQYDGTNLIWSQSNDFINWCVNRTLTFSGSFIAGATHVGYYLNTSNTRSGQLSGLTIYHAELTSP